MAKVIVELGARTAGLQSALGQLQGYVGRLAPQLAAMFTIGSVVAFTKATANAADTAGKLAQQAGMAVEKFSAWQHSASLANVSNEELVKSSAKLGEWLERNGRANVDLSEELLRQSDIISRMPDGQEKLNRVREIFGREGQKLIPLLNQGSKALREQMREAEKLGVTFDTKTAKAAEQFNDNLTRLMASLNGLRNQVIGPLLPELSKLSEKLLESAGSAAQFAQGLRLGLIGSIKEAMGGKVPLGWTPNQIAPGPIRTGAGAAPDPNRPMSDAGNAMLGGLKVETLGATAGGDPQREFERLNLLEGIAHEERLQKIAELGESAENARALELQAEELHKAQLLALASGHAEELIEVERRQAAKEKEIQERRVAATADMFGMMSNLARLFGRKGFIAYKALAIAESVVATYLGASKALAEGDTYTAAIRAAVIIGMGIANTAQIAAQTAQGFATGGIITGGEQLIRVNEQGTEGVVNAFGMQQIGAAGLEMINRGLVTAATLADAVPGSIASNIPGDVAFSAGDGGQGGGGAMNIFLVDSRATAEEWAASLAGESRIIEVVKNGKVEIGLPT